MTKESAIPPDDKMIKERCDRHYDASPLPTMGSNHEKPRPKDDELQILLNLYDTAVSGWRTLTDVRFKLLALLPALSVLAWSQIIRDGVPEIGRSLIAVAGLAISIGLWIYDTRNDGLYNELISRARRIELELGVDTGMFRGRPKPSGFWIRHGVATGVIYGTVILGWVVLLVWSILGVLD